MANKVTLSFAGDADQLAKEAKRAEAATAGVGDAAMAASKDMEKAGAETGEVTDRMSKLGNAVVGASTAVDDISGSVQAFADIQDAGRAAAAKLERALIDVEQAQQDLNQAVLDGKQGAIDAGQANLDRNQALIDEKAATQDLADAIKEFGVGSVEAMQAQQDFDQARADGVQAGADYNQALADQEQATIDARASTLDLADAQHELDPGPVQGLANQFALFGPVISGVTSLIAVAALAQGGLNLAFLASPITWVVLGIGLLVAAIVWVATQTTFFQDTWTAAWGFITQAAADGWAFIQKIPGWIGGAFAAVGEMVSAPFRAGFEWAQRAARDAVGFLTGIPRSIGAVFGQVGEAITAPFRSGFNAIRNLWNSTVGRLSWTVPGWVPFIGGNTISVPKLHAGGVIGGMQGSESVAILQAGERVTPRGVSAMTGGGATVRFAGNTSDALASVIMGLVRTGKIQISGV